MRKRCRAGGLFLAGAILAGCASPSSPTPPVVVAFSDVHFDPFFDPALLGALEAAPEGEWAGIFARSGITGPGRYGGTTNFPLLRSTLSSIQAGLSGPALVVFGGDILVQDFSRAYYKLAHTSDPVAMRAFARKTVSFVVHQVRAALGTTPVYFTLGNWDSYAGSFGLVPDDPFLADTADLFYEGLLAGTADRAAFDATYRTGGYYAAAVPGADLVVIGLNTIFLAPQAPAGIEAAVARELDWLDATLAAVETTGRRAWLVLHVPPGGDLATTGGDVDPEGHVGQPTMLLQAGPQERLLAILGAHRDVIAAAFTGHTHMDEYRESAVALQGLPGVTALMGNAPAYKVFTLAAGWSLQDYRSWALDLADPSASFQAYYDFATAYGLPGPLADALALLTPRLGPPGPDQSGYRSRYGSGHAPGKPITDLNWPVYRCGVSFLGAVGLADCVNGPGGSATRAW